jgi:hypothetical protein
MSQRQNAFATNLQWCRSATLVGSLFRERAAFQSEVRASVAAARLELSPIMQPGSLSGLEYIRVT